MKKNKSSFFIVLIITVLCVFGSLIPTVMNMSMGLNMGRNTIMLFDATSNTDEKVDSAKLMKIFESRAKFIRTNQYELSLTEDNKVAIEVPSTSEISWIQEYFTQKMNLEVRDTNNEVLLNADDFINASIYTDTRTVYIRLYYDQKKLASVTEAIKAKENSADRFMVVWTDYASGDSYAEEKKQDTPKYFSESSVSAENETGYIQVAGKVSETYTKQLIGLMNAGSANYKYTYSSNAFVGSYAAIETNKLVIGYGTLAGLVVIAIYAYLKYKKAGVLMMSGVALVYSLILGFFTLSSGVVSIQSLVGLWTALASLIGFEFFALKKTKLAALNGRGLESSLKIGYDSITKALLLSSVTFFTIGAIIYFVNIHFIRDFGMMLIIASIIMPTVGLFVVRGITTSLGSGKNASVQSIGIETVDYDPEALEKALDKENPLSKLAVKKWFKAVLATLIVVVLSGMALFATQVINLNPDNTNTSVLVVNSVDDEIYLKVQAILSEKGIQGSDYTYHIGDAKSWYVFNNTNHKLVLEESILSISDSTKLAAYTTTLSSFDKVGSVLNTTLIYTSLLIVVFALSALFYTFGFAKTAFAVSFFAGLSTLVLSSAVSLGVSSISITFAISGILVVAGLSYIYFSQLKETLETRKIAGDKQLFSTAVYKLYAESSDVVIPVAIAYVVFALTVFAMNQFVFILSLPSAIILSLIIFLVLAIIEPVLLSVTYSVKNTKNKKKGSQDKSKKKKSEKEELTVIGIND